MSSEGMEAARRYNDWMARRVAKWRFTRFAAMVGFVAAGALAWVLTGQFLLAFPLFGVAIVLFFFGLMAHEHLREIQQRRWKRLTPFIAPPAPPTSTTAPAVKT